VTWYTWIEQGRPINVSSQVLGAIARTLKLDATEQRYLRRLAGIQTAGYEAPVCDPEVLAAVQPLLDQLDPYPACLQTPLFDVVAYNDAYQGLFPMIDTVPVSQRNCARQFFENPDWRARYAEPETVAARMVARMRADGGAGSSAGQPQLIDHLLETSGEFADLWAGYDLLQGHNDIKALDSPSVGRLNLNFVSSIIPDTGHRMTVMIPVDPETREKLAYLASLVSPRS